MVAKFKKSFEKSNFDKIVLLKLDFLETTNRSIQNAKGTK